jgi:AraC family transcriptional regulator
MGRKSPKDADFQKEPLIVSKIFETPHPVHKAAGLWLLRIVKGVSNKPWSKPYRRVLKFNCLTHMYEGRGFLWMPGRGTQAVAPGDCILMPAGQEHCYGGDGEPFVEDAVCFSGQMASCLAANNLLRAGVQPLGQARRLLPLIALAQDPAPASQIKAAVALESLLLELASQAPDADKSSAQDQLMAKLIEAIRIEPSRWWAVKDMASFCGLSQAQFRRRFQEAIGMAPKSYVESLKLRQAAEELARGEGGIAEIARRHSYRDPYHFSRRFKAVLGMPPKRFLKSPFGL